MILLAGYTACFRCPIAAVPTRLSSPVILMVNVVALQSVVQHQLIYIYHLVTIVHALLYRYFLQSRQPVWMQLLQ